MDTLRHNDNTTTVLSAERGDAQIFLICLRQTRVYGKRMLLYVSHVSTMVAAAVTIFVSLGLVFFSWHAHGRNYCSATTDGIRKITADKPACKPYVIPGCLYRQIRVAGNTIGGKTAEKVRKKRPPCGNCRVYPNSLLGVDVLNRGNCCRCRSKQLGPEISSGRIFRNISLAFY